MQQVRMPLLPGVTGLQGERYRVPAYNRFLCRSSPHYRPKERKEAKERKEIKIKKKIKIKNKIKRNV